MKNVISKKVRRKMLNLIEQITDNSFISTERDTLLNDTDDIKPLLSRNRL